MTVRLARVACAWSLAMGTWLAMPGPALAAEESSLGLSGRVVDRAGAPVTGASVTVAPQAGGPAVQGETDADGRFALDPGGAGRYTVDVQHAGFASARRVVELAASGASVDVTLEVEYRETVTVEASTSRLATKADTPILTTPQAINLVPQEVLDDQIATSLSDAARNLSGVVQSSVWRGSYDIYAQRGFYSNSDGNFRVDGLERTKFVQLYNAATERIEQLKGPASVLYGRLDPGGVMNVVTKRPEPRRAHAVEVRTGSFGYVEGRFDTTGPLGSDRVLYRLNASLERGDSYRDEVEHRAAFVAPSLTLLLGSKTRLSVDAQFRNDEGTVDGGIASPEATFAAFDALPDDVFLNEPDARFSNRYLSLASTLEHQVASGWTLRAIVGNFDYDRKPFDVVLGALDSETLTVARRADFRDLDIGVLYGEAGALGSFETGSLRHSIAFGLTFDRRTSDEIRRRENIGSIDIRAPIYTGVPAFESMPLFRSEEGELEMLGVYLQDRIEIGEKVVAQLGARLTDLNQVDDDRLTDERQTIEATELTPQLGLVYRVGDDVSVYGSYSRSFDANSGMDADGRQFEPKFGEQFEAGVKGELGGGRLSLTAAAFRLTYDGLLGNIRNPETGVFETFRSGIQRSIGVEVDVQGRLTDSVRVIGSYTAMNAEVVEDPRFEPGRVLGGAPTHSGSLWLTYAPERGLGASAGVFFQTDFKNFTSSEDFLPGFATAEVAASYRFGRAAIRGVVKNLFDKRYYWDAFRNLAYPASPRSFRLSLQVGL